MVTSKGTWVEDTDGILGVGLVFLLICISNIIGRIAAIVAGIAPVTDAIAGTMLSLVPVLLMGKWHPDKFIRITIVIAIVILIAVLSTLVALIIVVVVPHIGVIVLIASAVIVAMIVVPIVAVAIVVSSLLVIVVTVSS